MLAALGALALGLVSAQLVLATPPAADFTAPSVLQIGQSGTFTSTTPDTDADGDTIASIQWDFENDGTFDDNRPSVSHAYGTSGEKTVRMLVTDSAGETDDATTTLRVNRVPTASFSAAPTPALIGQTVNFNGSASTDDTTITKYEWDLDGNGSFETDTGGTATTNRSYITPGDREVKLRVTDSDGVVSAFATRTVTVNNANPDASFTASPNPVQIGVTVTFDGSASKDYDPGGSITRYQWDLDGDGSFETDTGATKTASRSYGTAGTRTVQLLVTDNNGAQASTFRNVVVNAPPTAAITAAPNPQVTGQPVNFNGSGSSDSDGTITRYQWDLDGNGSFETDTGTTKTTSLSYSTSGTRNVRLLVTDNTGGTDDASVSVVIHAAPAASFTARGTKVDALDNPITPDVPDVGENVVFDASASTDPDGTIAKYEWDLDGNGSFETDTGTVKVSRSFPSRGNKTVGLRVTDNQGGTGQTTVTFRVNAVPVAGIFSLGDGVPPGTIPPPLPLVGQAIRFTSLSTDEESTGIPPSSIKTYDWLDAGPLARGPFGDGAFSVVHPPFKDAVGKLVAGDHLVVLRVTDTDGAVDDEVATVRVNTPPVANFSFSPQTPLTNEVITFDEAASDPDPQKVDALPNAGALVKFEWDLDGNASTGPEGFEQTGERVTASYSSDGPKSVRLRVTDGGGAKNVITKTVQVEKTRPNAAFGFAPDFPLPGQVVGFTSTSAPSTGKSIGTQEWDFDFDPMKGFAGDTTGSTASHVFSNPGEKLIALKVTETGGGFDIETHTVTVNAPPQASFAAAPSTPVTNDKVTFASTSADADGPITQAWDTDNDGQFDDGEGAVASRSFAQAGSYTIRLRVTDDRGASAVSVGSVKVAQRPAVGVLSGKLTVLDAVVQIAGRTTKRGARLSLLRVRGPVGTMVKLKCKGDDCPLRSKRRELKRSELRFKKLERKLRAGTKIVIEATLDGFIGKRVVFKIRKGKSPKRTDLCIQPGAKEPSACA